MTQCFPLTQQRLLIDSFSPGRVVIERKKIESWPEHYEATGR